MYKKVVLYVMVVVFLLSGCSNLGNAIRECPDAEISWADVLMVDSIEYSGHDRGLSNGENVEKGSKIGEVNFKLANNACSNHRLRNGDAAYLPVGTEIYEMEGYQTDFRVMAENKVYQVTENKRAASLSDLYDISGKVEKISLESSSDGSHIGDFNKQETAAFMEDFLSLKYAGFDKGFKKEKDANFLFLRIHLEDGSSFKTGYWLDENVLAPGAFATEKMKRMVEDKKERVN